LKDVLKVARLITIIFITNFGGCQQKMIEIPWPILMLFITKALTTSPRSVSNHLDEPLGLAEQLGLFKNIKSQSF
jgi:hypothetical protein